MLCYGNKAKELLNTDSLFPKKQYELSQAEKCANTTLNSL